MSTDLHTLSGAYALNALSAEEAEQFRHHLEACPACRLEVRELQQAAATMGASEAVAPPTYLKARVLTAVDRTPQLPPRASGGNVIHVAPHRWGRALLLAAAALVVVVGGLVGISRIGNAPQQEPSLLATGVVRVFDAKDAHAATMKTEVDGRSGEVRVAASPKLNQMAVDTHELPPLDNRHVYQLWAVHDGAMTSVAVLRREKGASMAMPGPNTEVAITVEPAPSGSPRPTTDPIMRVNPSSLV
jgi:anti-sigma-K factor RskA